MPDSLSAADALRSAIRAQLREARVCLPARVERYDASLQKADVWPLLYDAHVDEAGTRIASALGVVSNCPVVWPGGGGMRLTFPLAPGDTVLCLFCDRSLDAWLSHGGAVDPVDPRAHHLSDGIVLAGLHDFAHAWRGADTGGVSLGVDGGLQVHVKASHIGLGEENPAEAVALAGAVLARLTTLAAALNGIAPGSVALPLAGVGSSTVRVKS